MELDDALKLRKMIEQFMIAVPRVLREGVFKDRAKKGFKAEDIVFDWLQRRCNARVFRFGYRAGLTDETLPREVKAWLEALPIPPDGLVRLPGGEVFFADVKFKSKEYWVVNKTDYDHYYLISQILPVRIYFYVKATRKIYEHKIMCPDDFKTKVEWNGNTVYIIPGELIKEVKEVGN